MKPQPGIPKLPFAETEFVAPVIVITVPLTEEQKTWPVVPLSKMMNAKPKPKLENTPTGPA